MRLVGDREIVDATAPTASTRRSAPLPQFDEWNALIGSWVIGGKSSRDRPARGPRPDHPQHQPLRASLFCVEGVCDNADMTKDQIRAILDRVPTWPPERQQELGQIALEIEAAVAGEPYRAMSEELAAIDAGRVTDEEVEAAFVRFRAG